MPAPDFEAQVTVPLIYKSQRSHWAFAPTSWSKTPPVSKSKPSPSFSPRMNPSLTYPRMNHLRIGLLINFHAPRLKDGLCRFIV
jgi:hypothetical protein